MKSAIKIDGSGKIRTVVNMSGNKTAHSEKMLDATIPIDLIAQDNEFYNVETGMHLTEGSTVNVNRNTFVAGGALLKIDPVELQAARDELKSLSPRQRGIIKDALAKIDKDKDPKARLAAIGKISFKIANVVMQLTEFGLAGYDIYELIFRHVS